MAQLKTLLVNGATKLAGTLYANLLKTNTIEAPTEPGGIEYGPGTDGQVLKSDGENVYWGTVNTVDGIPYAVCDTASTTVEKTITVPGITELTAGLMIGIKFTESSGASSPTLNVNGLGARPLYQYGTTAIGSTSATNGWYAGAFMIWVYDGSGWIRTLNTNSSWSAMSVAEYQAGTSTTSRLMTPERLKGAINYHAPMPAAPSSNGTYVLQVSVSSGTPTYSWVSLTTWQGGSY